MKKHHALVHMEAAHVYSKLCHCERLKVGCLVVKDDRVISIGVNGMPSGMDNCCEDEHNQTRPEVLHAEFNAIGKLAASHESGEGATMFLTHAPCVPCARLIDRAKIAKVYYAAIYNSNSSSGTEGLEYLQTRNIETELLELK